VHQILVPLMIPVSPGSRSDCGRVGARTTIWRIDWWLVAIILNARVDDAGYWHSLTQFPALPALLTRQ